MLLPPGGAISTPEGGHLLVAAVAISLVAQIRRLPQAIVADGLVSRQIRASLSSLASLRARSDVFIATSPQFAPSSSIHAGSMRLTAGSRHLRRIRSSTSSPASNRAILARSNHPHHCRLDLRRHRPLSSSISSSTTVVVRCRPQFISAAVGSRVGSRQWSEGGAQRPTPSSICRCRGLLWTSPDRI